MDGVKCRPLEFYTQTIGIWIAVWVQTIKVGSVIFFPNPEASATVFASQLSSNVPMASKHTSSASNISSNSCKTVCFSTHRIAQKSLNLDLVMGTPSFSSLPELISVTASSRRRLLFGEYLTHWGRDKMAVVSQTTLSNAFSWMKMLEFRLRFLWSLFLRVQLTIIQHWFRQWLGAGQATSHYLNQWWLVYWRIYASLGLNELKNIPSCFTVSSVTCISLILQLLHRTKFRSWLQQ